jgi:hypothetical protein
MDVAQIPCAHCGTVNEIVGRRTFGDYNPLCNNCQEPVREARRIEFVGGNGGLYLQHIPSRGLGVFARTSFKEGSIVERCPAYVVQSPLNLNAVLSGLELYPYTDSSVHQKTTHMCLPWMNDKERAIILGYGMIYNHEHQAKSNVRYRPYVEPDTNRRFMDYVAKRDLVAHEELTFTYAAQATLWFDAKVQKS